MHSIYIKKGLGNMISTVIPAYYYRDVTKAAVTQNETQLIYAIVYNAFLVSQFSTPVMETIYFY